MDSFIGKYKPYFVKDFYLNEKTKIVLNLLIDMNDVNILFIGNAGTGKTTLLFAMIRDYYGLSETAIIPETNILFINNLKEQGIQYFRNEMKTFCKSQCSIYGKKKMIVIDDLDSINEQSQQVFRNYIDKYKQNIHFVFACTNIQKVIDSIQSRIHMIYIDLPTNLELMKIMNTIVEKENITIDEESKEYLLKLSNHSVRHVINYLEKIMIFSDKVDLSLCKKICSNISNTDFEKYVAFLNNGNLTESIYLLNQIHSFGYSVIDILDFFFAFIKTTDTMCENMKYNIIPFLCKYITIFNDIHEDHIELTFFTNQLYKLFQKEKMS
jgi:DNA polymerase III delta prime subunit